MTRGGGKRENKRPKNKLSHNFCPIKPNRCVELSFRVVVEVVHVLVVALVRVLFSLQAPPPSTLSAVSGNSLIIFIWLPGEAGGGLGI